MPSGSEVDSGEGIPDSGVIMIQEANRLGGFAMGHAVAVRGDYTSGHLLSLGVWEQGDVKARRRGSCFCS